MKVDDAGRRAGAALRDRFDRLPAPPLAETAPRRPRSGRTAVLAGVAAVLVIVLFVALVAPWREDDQQPSGPGGTWKRIDTREAFGRDASPIITAWKEGLLALGAHRGSSNSARPRPVAWTSNDGEHWDPLEIDHAPRSFGGWHSVTTRGDVIVAGIDNNGQIWRSTDARRWLKVVDAEFHRGTSYFVQRTHDRFVSWDVGPLLGGRTMTSVDGRTWRSRLGSYEGDHPVGLSVGAPLGRKWITLGGTGFPEVTPRVYSSADGARWSRITDAKPPIRLSAPLVANDARSRVLGIQYEPQGQFGGRLWSTRNGATWGEIPSFHKQMPVGNPDHLVQVGNWWVLGGNTGTPDGKRRASMWVSPDLKRWDEMPARFRGPKNDGAGMLVLEHQGRVIGYSGADRFLWIWTPPS